MAIFLLWQYDIFAEMSSFRDLEKKWAKNANLYQPIVTLAYIFNKWQPFATNIYSITRMLFGQLFVFYL